MQLNQLSLKTNIWPKFKFDTADKLVLKSLQKWIRWVTRKCSKETDMQVFDRKRYSIWQGDWHTSTYRSIKRWIDLPDKSDRVKTDDESFNQYSILVSAAECFSVFWGKSIRLCLDSQISMGQRRRNPTDSVRTKRHSLCACHTIWNWSRKRTPQSSITSQYLADLSPAYTKAEDIQWVCPTRNLYLRLVRATCRGDVLWVVTLRHLF